MTTVIRVEHTNGIGMFRQDVGVYKVNSLCECAARHASFNTPWEDPKLMYIMSSDYFCAYKTLGQFKEWVTDDEVRELLRIGFKVFAIEVGECYVGSMQVIYKKEHIFRITDISELFA